MSILDDSDVIGPILGLLKRNLMVGVVTAAGYSESEGNRYYERLKGLIDSIDECLDLSLEQKRNFFVVGGECNYLFRFNELLANKLEWIDKEKWETEEAKSWTTSDIAEFLNIAEKTLINVSSKLEIGDKSKIICKKKAVGIIQKYSRALSREQLEEIVLTCQKKLENCESAKRIKFCAFNGGNDVWIDIGDKSVGVKSLQSYLGGIETFETLHVGDQFASINANDFKARLVACTAWVANPHETIEIVRDINQYVSVV
ncbi:IMP 5'-nucleotidase [Ascoidea rubescens DSM 1968]|uniref:IMP-specific 5'-nucleotidase 1 n=1 Tax=Ascoidea rubescens DSM 1968 TaxID=1344418 RepID=A0A1D2VLR6_9ASCO|nr:IMP-specific 5-nucleotidase [Ascoidea rubescens DSM 1968]ODV62515.1 IMP-specific 5-nucleotidase [Ascoidea rubescens DSM 1968]